MKFIISIIIAPGPKIRQRLKPRTLQRGKGEPQLSSLRPPPPRRRPLTLGTADPGDGRPPGPRKPLTRRLPGVDPVRVGDAGDGEDIGGQKETS